MFDSHAHVVAPQFDKDRDAVIQHAKEVGLFGWLEVGTDIEQSRKAIALAESQEGVHAAVGVHPSDIASLTEVDWKTLDELLVHKKVKAVGEVGLDFYRGGNLSEQTNVLLRFLDLAKKYILPIVFHVRSGKDTDAHDELLQILSSLPLNQRPRGVIHTFSGTVPQAKKYVDLGLYISFSGVVTFSNAKEIADAAQEISLENILIETDCPFLTPMPHRGKRNEPAYVKFVAEKIADLKNTSVENVVEHTDANARKLFSLPS